MKFLLLAIILCIPMTALAQKFPDMAPTPPMGWNSWNTFQTKIDQKLIHETAQAMIANGMRDAGYVYINLDDGWSAMQRDAKGNLVGDPERFPDGMKALGDYLHSHGFKFGIYNCAGTKTCAGYPGGKDHEFQDAKTYASWGVDYLKYDWCNTEGMDAPAAYKKMSQAIHEAGRPMVFSICEWGGSKPWLWAADVAQLWRTTGDIGPWYDRKAQWQSGWKLLLDKQVGLEKYAGPNHWNDPDMLEAGVGELTFAESRAHFSLWCMLAAPLIAGNDVRHMTPEINKLLINRQAIAIDQDPLGKEGYRISADANHEVWVKELSHGKWAVCILNTTKEIRPVTLRWKDLNFLHGNFMVKDVWTNQSSTTGMDFTGQLASHDVALLVLTPK